MTSAIRPDRFDGVGAGILLRLASTGLFAVMSLTVRAASFEAPVGQIVFFRSAFALPVIVGWMLWEGQLPSALRTKRPWGHVRRSLLGGTSMVLSFVSLAHLPLASATALGFVAPLLLVPAAALFLAEKPGPVIWIATLAGFGGVLAMLAPAFDGGELDGATMIGVGAGLAMAVTTAAAKVQIKSLTRTEAPGSIALWFAVVSSLIGSASLPLGWIVPSGATLAWLIASGLAGGLAYVTMTEALARAPASTLAPFEYTGLLWALVFDLLVFAVLPPVLGLLGATTIVAAAAVVAGVEHRSNRDARRP